MVGTAPRAPLPYELSVVGRLIARLVFCIFKKSDFVETVVPVIQGLKFDFWGHDAVVLRGYEIRKQLGDFNILREAKIRAAFIDQLNGAIEGAPFTVSQLLSTRLLTRESMRSLATLMR
jgi:hypothetical protein